MGRIVNAAPGQSGKAGRLRLPSGRTKKAMDALIASDLVSPREQFIEAPASCSPEEALRIARGKIHEAMPTIIGAIIGKAKSGSCQHAKFLMEFALEKANEVDMGAEDEEESLASILLRELREGDAEARDAG